MAQSVAENMQMIFWPQRENMASRVWFVFIEMRSLSRIGTTPMDTG